MFCCNFMDIPVFACNKFRVEKCFSRILAIRKRPLNAQILSKTNDNHSVPDLRYAVISCV